MNEFMKWPAQLLISFLKRDFYRCVLFSLDSSELSFVRERSLFLNERIALMKSQAKVVAPDSFP